MALSIFMRICALLPVILICLLPLVAATVPRSMSVVPALVALGCWGCFYTQNRRWPTIEWVFVYWSLALAGLMAASALWALDPSFALSRAAKILPLLLAGVMLLAWARQADSATLALIHRLFPLAFVFGLALCLVWMAAGYYELITLAPDKNPNLSYQNRGVVALILLLLPALVFARSAPRWLWALGSLLLTIMLFVTDSQSAHLALLIGLFFLFFFPAGRPWIWPTLQVILIALIIGAPFLAQFLYSQLAEASTQIDWLSQGYAASRMEIWDFIARAALEKPWLGHGVEAARQMHFDTKQLFFKTDTVLHPHNFVLQFWLEFGLLGAVFLSGFLGDIWRRLQTLPAAGARLGAAVFFATITTAAITYGIWQGWWIGVLSLLPALATLAIRVAHRDVLPDSPILGKS
ncbi:MAG: O-antigen ligase family protein [Alphaproteobacteria bacterium]|nr:O-antigen ligase family protein [Alphaproteobacteria bacterium]